MLINFHILLITKRFFRSFDRHSDKTVTLCELLQDINNFSKTIVDVIRKSHEFSFKIERVITIVVLNPVNFLVNARLWRQSIASWYSMTSRFSFILLLSPPSYILYTLFGVIPCKVYRLKEVDASSTKRKRELKKTGRNWSKNFAWYHRFTFIKKNYSWHSEIIFKVVKK